MPNPTPIDFDTLDIPAARTRAPRQERVKTITKASLRSMFQMSNAAFDLTDNKDLKLTDDELDSLTDVWYQVIKEYPQFSRMVSAGNKLTIWGNALFVTFVIVEKRRSALSNQNTTRTSRDTVRHDGVGQDDSSKVTDFFSTLRDSAR